MKNILKIAKEILALADATNNYDLYTDQPLMLRGKPNDQNPNMGMDESTQGVYEGVDMSRKRYDQLDFMTENRDWLDDEALAEAAYDARAGSKKVAEKVYHGTSLDNAQSILQKGFVSGIGMSSSPNDNFVFVSPQKAVARHFASDNIRIKQPVILVAELQGKILDLKKSMADYEAFGIVSDLLNARPKQPKIEDEYDEKLLIAALKQNSYSGFSYKDSNAGNRLTYCVIPAALKPINFEQVKTAQEYNFDEDFRYYYKNPKGTGERIPEAVYGLDSDALPSDELIVHDLINTSPQKRDRDETEKYLTTDQPLCREKYWKEKINPMEHSV